MTNDASHETYMQANKAVAACCSHFGLENGVFDERRRLDLMIDDRPVSFRFVEGDPSFLWVGCEIGAVDRGDREALSWLLRAGMQPWLLYGQRIGLLPGAATAVIYTFLYAKAVNEQALAVTVDMLLDAAAELGDKLARCDFTQGLHKFPGVGARDTDNSLME